MCYRASREEKELDGLRVRRNIRRFQSESRNTDPSSSKSCEEYQEKLDDLRLKRGTRESRRKLRHEFRSRSRMGKSHFPGPSVTKAKQVTCYVPPTDRPPLSTISVSIVELSRRRPRSNDDGLVTQISELELSTRASSALPGLMKLAQETREQIYGYILPIHVKKMFQAKGCETEIPSPTVVCPCDGGFTSPVLPDHGGKDRTAIMRVNKQIHREAQAYLFRGCTIRIRVDETGYSFLEHVSGGPFLDSTRRLCGTMSGNTRGSILVPGHIPSDARILNYECRDRFTEWHRTFVSKFDFSLPKKLIISVEAPDYENAEGVLQIAESMMSLCEVLRRCPKIKEIEVEPQRPKCRYTSKDYYDYDPKHNTRGSFFVWQWEDHSSPASQPCRHHTCNRNRFRFEREALWAGKLSCVLLPNKPDLQIVLQPLRTLGNVTEATIKHPPTTAESTASIQKIFDRICADMKGRPSTVEQQIAAYGELAKECQQRLQDPEIKLRVKKAKRTKAKDIWYWWHSETRDEEFTENGEQGYESDDEPDW